MSRCTKCSAGIMCQCVSGSSNNKNTECNHKHELKGDLLNLVKTKEYVDHPDHYLKSTGHEVKDVVRAWKLNFELGNAVKYIARAGKKHPEKYVEDLQKAIWYINEEIECYKKEKIEQIK